MQEHEAIITLSSAAGKELYGPSLDCAPPASQARTGVPSAHWPTMVLAAERGDHRRIAEVNTWLG